MTTKLTTEDLAEVDTIRQRHNGDDAEGCFHCADEWPCDTVKLLEYLSTSQRVAADLRAENERLKAHHDVWAETASGQWQCVAEIEQLREWNEAAARKLVEAGFALGRKDEEIERLRAALANILSAAESALTGEQQVSHDWYSWAASRALGRDSPELELLHPDLAAEASDA